MGSAVEPGQSGTFAEWMSSALRREGLTQEAAARQLGVSVKTVSRWVGGATEPRMRDLRRIQEVFGEVPLP
jgi:transcriptional regulator with XRE-family HTH domain